MSVSPALRPPPGHPRFPLLDGMRAVAIVIVVFAHVSVITRATSASWGWIPMNAPIADAIFFALSGFLLYRPFASGHAGIRPAPRVGDFTRRRVLRIIPPYWLALTVLALFPGIAGVFSSHWWIYYGFGQIYTKLQYANGIPDAGYICIIVTFYLLVPPLAAAAGRLAKHWKLWWRAEIVTIGAFALVGPAATWLLRAHDLPWGTHSFIIMTDWPAAGMAMAVVSVALERRNRVPRTLSILARGWVAWSLGIGLFLLAAGPFDAYDYLLHPRAGPPSAGVLVMSNLVFAASATMMLVPAVFGSGGLLRRLLAWRPVAYLGLVSYGVYLWHFPLAAWLASWHGPPDIIPGTSGGLGVQRLLAGHATTLVLFVATLGVSTLVASASYRWIELPFLRRKETQRPGRSRYAVVADAR